MTEVDFLKEVSAHQMIVLRDEGVHRHIRFKKPGTMCMHFDLITWPGYLCYTGDMGTYVFRRLEDMFEFFRTDRKSDREGLCINKGYWAEKIEAADRCDGIKTFSEEKFTRAVMEYLVTWIRENRDRTTPDERRDLWNAVIDEVIHEESDGGGYRKQCAAIDFWCQVNEQVGRFRFQDFWETDCTVYAHRFVWCCYALAWGIQVYDKAQIPAPEVAA